MQKKSKAAGKSNSTIAICRGLRINDAYSALIKRSDNSDQNQFLKDNLAEARWFLRSIESRNETLMRVAMTIVDLQQGFLDYGPSGDETNGAVGYRQQTGTA